jgi:outer membrane protein assembly factor BamB
VTLDTGADDELDGLLAAPQSAFWVLGRRSLVSSYSGILANLAYRHVFVSKRDSTGNELWFHEFATGLQYSAASIARGPGEAVAVTASTLDDNLNWGGIIWLLNSDGSLGLTVTIPSTEAIEPKVVVGAGDGGVVVAGSCNLQPWIAKYSSAGTLVWSQVDSTVQSGDMPELVVGNDGSIWVVSADTGGTFLRRYSSDGEVQWSVPVAGAGSGGLMAVGSDGSLYLAVAADNRPSAGNVVVRYSTDGQEILRWPIVDQEYPWQLAYTSAGVFVMAGNFGTRKLSQFDAENGTLLGSFVVSNSTTNFTILDSGYVVLGSMEGEDIGLELVQGLARTGQ